MTEKRSEIEQTALAPAISGGEEGGILEFLTSPFHSLANDFSEFIRDRIERVGIISIFFLNTLYWLVAKPTKRDTLLHSFYTIGVLSIPVVMLTGTFIGMVLAVQTYTQFKALGIETRIGAVINLSLLRELGPVLAATMLAGRVGSSIAAELGTMRVTEQIDALTSMGTNPIHYLVVPRFISCLVLIPALTAMGDFAGVVGGAFYCTQILPIEEYYYWKHSSNFVTLFDLFAGMFKSMFFGAAIAIISCYQGFHCEPGAEGVGKAATKSFVFSFVVILLLDLLLGIILERFYLLFWTPPLFTGGG